VGVFCCRVLAVLCKVCNFLALSGVKGVIFLSTFPSWQPETGFPEVLILCIFMLSAEVCFTLVLYHLKDKLHHFYACSSWLRSQ